MVIENFPELENFQKLPRKVIVRVGNSADSDEEETELKELQGIVINNSGYAIKNTRVNVVIFDKRGMPMLSTNTVPDPEELPQGGIGSFLFEFQETHENILNYHVYATWRFDDL